MKILYFTKYSRLGASSRLRSFQYFPYLEAAGYTIEVYPLFSDTYLEKLYDGHSSKFLILRSYVKRFFYLLKISKHNHLIIEKELFPYMPAWVEIILFYLGIKYIVDYDDAIFHNYDKHPNKIIRQLLKYKIDKVMRYSSFVVAGNSYLAERAIQAGAKHIDIIPTVIDLNRYNKSIIKRNKKQVIGWIGSPSTFRYVKNIESVLEKITLKYDVYLHIIGSGAERLSFEKNVKYISWREDSEVDEILKFDVGIMPLEDSGWEKGKCAYKLIQYMGCKKPVIASAVGMNMQVVEDNVNGFLVNSIRGWYEKLSFYLNDTGISRKHGLNGYDKVIDTYNVEKASDRLISIIRS
ncbi:glycosyltransferase [Psychroflexus gondwanensis ACAM 44]|uniref:Glycosyltransferase n=1 Tax=Psychroflexus gondwanensis ACAM 44 TaxID=1189619 RepID=N1WTY0_9FLAO|nr:glycosyltransferase family 4 protein [Psychroflexus gondwanensis]EMY80662.1 glycosyltransferase [Psychroflexus gondwanensis ACAM 44]